MELPEGSLSSTMWCLHTNIRVRVVSVYMYMTRVEEMTVSLVEFINTRTFYKKDTIGILTISTIVTIGQLSAFILFHGNNYSCGKRINSEEITPWNTIILFKNRAYVLCKMFVETS